MAQIYNFNTRFELPYYKSFFSDFNNNTITYNINVTDQLLTVEVVRAKTGTETSDLVLYNFSLALSTLTEHERLSDHSLWTFDSLTTTPASGNVDIIQSYQLLPMYDTTVLHKLKTLAQTIELQNKFACPFRIFVPHKNISSFNDLVFLIGTFSPDKDSTSTVTIVVNVNSPNVWNNTLMPNSNLLSSITSSTSLSSVPAGTTIPVTVTCANTNVSTLYLEQVCGILDRTQVNLTNGVGKFNILTNTLVAGETVKVKIGYKTYSNVSTFTQLLS